MDQRKNGLYEYVENITCLNCGIIDSVMCYGKGGSKNEWFKDCYGTIEKYEIYQTKMYSCGHCHEKGFVKKDKLYNQKMELRSE